MNYRTRIFTSISIVVVAAWLSFRGMYLLPQWANTAIYYFLIVSAVYMIVSIKKPQDTLRVTKLQGDGEEAAMYEVNGKIFTEEETIIWIANELEVSKKEASDFLKKVLKRDQDEEI
ncbi:hypothetical protein QK289_15590 [Exiguobacterium antarcticum]|uniref:Uncharacterized protein n=1 Tax=Exiguobacterium antarcticum TaxID=132920 RepID=A0ABT6R646_9BACL|nr:hypothetical protein [Exiguobacterium antarcticum]MDI3236438.1 hypothetical protein [Exiguobacterium antarcticum]